MMFNDFVDRCIKAGVLTLTLALVGCGGTNDESDASVDPHLKTIAIDGSSTVYPISKAMAVAFTATTAGENADITVQFSGTSAGFREFCTGKTDISDASRPILIAELNQCIENGVPFIEIPVAFDALTVAVNPQNTWLQDLSVAELATLWQKASEQKLTRWNQLRPDFPDEPISLWGAGGDSGTFDYFNEAILGDPRGARADYTGSEDDDEIVAGIAANPNALGYLPFAYFEPNMAKLRAIPINNGSGAIAPGVEAVQSSQYQPLSRPLFLYVNAQKAQEKPLLRQFIEFYVEKAPEIVTQVGYVPLTEEGYQLANLQFIRGEVGTAFKGVPEPDLTIEELLRRQVVFQDSQASVPNQ